MTCIMLKYITALEDLSKSGCQDTAINLLSVKQENSCYSCTSEAVINMRGAASAFLWTALSGMAAGLAASAARESVALGPSWCAAWHWPVQQGCRCIPQTLPAGRSSQTLEAPAVAHTPAQRDVQHTAYTEGCPSGRHYFFQQLRCTQT